jgi:hypothetical protein
MTGKRNIIFREKFARILESHKNLLSENIFRQKTLIDFLCDELKINRNRENHMKIRNEQARKIRESSELKSYTLELFKNCEANHSHDIRTLTQKFDFLLEKHPGLIEENLEFCHTVVEFLCDEFQIPRTQKNRLLILQLQKNKKTNQTHTQNVSTILDDQDSSPAIALTNYKSLSVNPIEESLSIENETQLFCVQTKPQQQIDDCEYITLDQLDQFFSQKKEPCNEAKSSTSNSLLYSETVKNRLEASASNVSSLSDFDIKLDAEF